ncbi:MAG: amidohydrolase family protein [Planctomycetota bacterium]
MKQRPLLTLTLGILVLAGHSTALQDSRPKRKKPPAQPAAKKAGPKKAKKTKKPKPKPIAYTNATVHVGRNGVVLRGATVLIEGKTIKKVGSKLDLPKGTKTVDCKGKHISPGFVVPSGSRMGGISGSIKDKYADSIDPFDRTIKRGLAVGLPSFAHSSGGGSSSPAGKSALVKFIPEELDDAVLEESILYTMRVPLGPSNWKKFKDSVEKVRKHQKAIKDYERKKAEGDKKAKEPKLDKKLEPTLAIIEGKSRLKISAGSISFGFMRGGRGGMTLKLTREALKIAKLLEVGVILDNPYEGWIIPDEIAVTGSSCILMPRGRMPRDETRKDENGSNLAACKILDAAGVPVCVMPPPGRFGGSGLGTSGLLGRDLNTPFMDACFAIRGGMDPERALSTITYNPAKALGVDDHIGSIEPGKDADLLILNGHPLSYKTFVLTAIVNGKVRYEKDKVPLYGHIRKSSSGSLVYGCVTRCYLSEARRAGSTRRVARTGP